jgi:hypothetical protein
MTMRDGDPRIRSLKEWPHLPLAAGVVAILALLVLGYNFGNEPSHSEKYGTVTQTEAEDGVTPSMAPDAGMEPSRTSDTTSPSTP